MGANPNPRPTPVDSYPATGISWDEAQEFVQKLNDRAGRRLYRLPTEAEWEYAARAESLTAFSFGDDPDDLFQYGNCLSRKHDDGYEGPAPVGSFKPNQWGLYDMHGNVWEWVEDRYGLYGSAPEVDPVGPSGEGEYRVRRGGAYDGKAENCRSSTRIGTKSSLHHKTIGFRLVQDLR